MSTLLAGVSRVNITPPVGMYLVGMERSENSHGLRDDLFATALALSDGQVEVVIVSMDVLVVNPEFVARVRQETSVRSGVPVGNVLLHATHCHSGPLTFAFPGSQPMLRAYVDNLFYLLVGLVQMAHDRLAPAVLGFGRGQTRIGINRRLTRPDGVTVIAPNPERPVDPEVGVVRIDHADGRPLAVLVNYACHPVVLGNGSNVISADWPGAMRRLVESATGATCLFIQGAGADINPWPGVPCDREDVLERLGMQIGGEVVSTWAGIEPAAAERIAVDGQKIELPLLPPSQFEGRLPKFVELEEAMGGMTWDQLQAWLDEKGPWRAEIVGQGDERRAVMELQAIRLGQVGLVSAAGEIFVKTGLAVKARSPFAHTLFAGYSNGLVCYIPLPEDYPNGGYEVFEAYLACRLPAPVAPQAAGMVEDAAVSLLERLKTST